MDHINTLYRENSQTGTLANSEEPDEMPLNVSFNQSLHCWLRSLGTDVLMNLENLTCVPLRFTMDHTSLIVSKEKNGRIHKYTKGFLIFFQRAWCDGPASP